MTAPLTLNTELVSELRDRLDKRQEALNDEVARGWTDKFENAADWATLTIPFNELVAVFDALDSTSRALSEKEGELAALQERFAHLVAVKDVHADKRFEATERAETAERQRDEALAALKASEEREAGLREALSRQTDNMAFILNHAAVLPDQWFEKFDRELTEDRVPLAGSRPALAGNLADATKKDPGTEQREAGR